MKVNKKLLTIGGALSIGLLPLAVVSCSTNKETTYFESENLKISSEGEIIGYADESHKQFGSLVIKEKYNGVTIKRIASNAFKDQTGIDEITLPKTLVSIGSRAFYNIKSPVSYASDHDPLIPIKWDLSHLINLESIDEYAFYSSKESQQKISLNLKNLNKLKIIYSHAFRDRGISSVDIPNSVTTIDEYAFANNQLTSITIPNSVTTIDEYAFENNQLTSITIPNSLTTIEKSVFLNNQLTSITIPNSVTTIGKLAFASNQLTSITIPNSVTIIGAGAFYDNQISSIDIPNSVTTIEELAFSNNQLTSIDIPNSVTTIGKGAFANNQLTSITIPNSVTTIEGMVSEFELGAFENNQLTSINIPDSVTTIGDNAFKKNLFADNTKIILPTQFNTASERTRIGIDLPLVDTNNPTNNSKIETLIPLPRRKEH